MSMLTPPGASGHQLPGAPSHTLRFRFEGLGSEVVTYLVSGLTCALCDGAIHVHVHHSTEARGGPCTHLPNMP